MKILHYSLWTVVSSLVVGAVASRDHGLGRRTLNWKNHNYKVSQQQERNINNVHLKHRTLDVRTSNIDTSGMICDIGAPNTGGDIAANEISYYVALGSSADLGPVDLHNFQMRIYATVEQHISWCYKNGVATYDGDFGASGREAQSSDEDEDVSSMFGIKISQGDFFGGGGGERRLHKQRHLTNTRQLQASNFPHRERYLNLLRKLNILSVSSGPFSNNVGACPEKFQDKIDETGATSCKILEGNVRVLAENGDSLEYLAASLRDTIEEALNEDQVWKQWGDEFPDVVFSCYAGDTYDDVFNPIVPDGGDGDGGGMGVFPTNVGSEEEDDDDDDGGAGLAIVLGVGIPVATALIAASAIFARRERTVMTAEDHASTFMDSNFVLVGTGDPPGSFHEGLYHYMRNGQRYLSTNCEGCVETRRNSFFTDDVLGTIMEDSQYEESILINVDSKDLGRNACTQDVHRCSSSTCIRCFPRDSSKTTFVHSGTLRKEPEVSPVTTHIEV